MTFFENEGHSLLMQDWDAIAETWLFGSIENPIPARPLAAEAIPDSVWLGSHDVSLHWRGDGKFFATASRAQSGTCHGLLI